MPKPTYKLMYFDMRGRGETMRMMFAAAGVEYEDFRIPSGEWPKYKLETPNGQVPVLYIDDQKLAQSGAILRYLSREFKLGASTPIEKAKADMHFHTLDDIWAKFPFSDDEDGEKKKDWVEKQLFPFFQVFEDRCKNEPTAGYFICKNLTYFDFLMQNTVFTLKGMVERSKIPIDGLMDKFPGVQKIVDKIENVPKIKAWLEKRPKTDL